MIMADYPIENKDEDKLRRAPLAKKVAELIASFKGKESFVIGIEGVWGSGKTSFVNLALKELKDDPTLIFINFNPWNFTGQNELISDFFSALTEELKGRIDNKIFKTVKSYAQKLQISYSPSISTPIGSFGIGELGKNKDSLQKQREKINKALKQLDKKIVIVIDDIDRLDEEETRLTMKLVKMTANFPNTVFVLAYDRGQVAQKLGKDGVGEEYLKKIIQVSFTLPMPDQQGLQKILFGDLDETISTIYGVVKLEGNDEKRWGDLLYKGFQEPFKTVRDIKRYISSLRLNWSIVEKEDVNQIDFMAIEAIRVFAPTLYSGIAANPSLFTGIYSTSDFGDNNIKNLQAKFKELISELPTELQESMEGICEVLFPNLDNTHYGSDREQVWKRERRICFSERFGFYFQLGIPDGAISEVEANTLAENFGNQPAFSEKIIELAKDKRLRTMLVKILDRVDTLTEEQVKIIISTLWNLEKEIADERNEIFDFNDIETQVSRITYHAIKHLPKEKRFEVLEYLVKNCKTFYTPTHFVAMLEDQQKNEQRSEEPLITAEETEKLKTISLAGINKLVGDNKLQEEPKFIFALYRWKEWDNADKVKDYIKALVSTRKGLLTFLKGFVGKVLSSNGNYYQLDKKSIEPLYTITDIETLVHQITDEEIASLDDKDKEAINLFKNPRRW
ncbi:MAG TPA: P-loop NTPase fold protein [Candidatus Magasanikbacteria bacterium]|nr:P-loop NTPase fold protein [Candidatus Magasanikbacteria bacterium]